MQLLLASFADLPGSVAAPTEEPTSRQRDGVDLSCRDGPDLLQPRHPCRKVTIPGIVQPELTLAVPSPCVNAPATAERKREMHAGGNRARTFRQLD